MSTYNIEVERSPGGVSDGDYEPLAMLTNGGAGYEVGAPLEYDDSAAVPGQLYYYRARYVCPDDPDTHSDWVYFIAARGPYPFTKGTSMTCVFTAAQAQAGMGVEGSYGKGVQSVYGLDVLTHSFPPPKAIARSQANRGVPSAVSDAVDAAVNPAGTLTFDLRPTGGVPRMFLAGYKLLSTTTVAAAGDVPEYYIHKLVPAFTESPVSLMLVMGIYALTVMGTVVNTLGMECDKNARNPIRVSAGVNYLNYVWYNASTSPELTALGLAALSYDVKKYGPTDWYLSINGEQSPDCRRFSDSFNRNLVEKQVGNLKTGPTCHQADKSDVSGSADLYFTGLDQVKQYIGQASGAALPFGTKKAIETGEVRLVIEPPAASNNLVHKIEKVFPVCDINGLTTDLPETGPIMLPITWTPHQDPANGYIDHYILWTTTETAASLATAAPEIGMVPDTGLHPYNAIQGIASGSPTTTVVASAAAAAPYPALSSVDDAYNGLTVRFVGNVTTALKGIERTISDYVGSTRTFTLGSALGAAPAAGDRFIVIGGWGI